MNNKKKASSNTNYSNVERWHASAIINTFINIAETFVIKSHLSKQIII